MCLHSTDDDDDQPGREREKKWKKNSEMPHITLIKELSYRTRIAPLRMIMGGESFTCGERLSHTQKG